MDITWLGHSAFRVTFGEAVVLIDPFLNGNPKFPGNYDEIVSGCTHVLLTHGHDDHVGDTLSILKAAGAQLVSTYEVCSWLSNQGAENVNVANHGGTVDCGGFTVSLTKAVHSSSTMIDGQMIYLGEPAGLVIQAEGQPTLYHMGDTDIFSDMALICELYRPAIGIVPIGDRFTMGAHSAAMACKKFFEFKTVIPCHFGTFPIIDETADKFVSEMDGQNVRVMVPGETASL